MAKLIKNIKNINTSHITIKLCGYFLGHMHQVKSPIFCFFLDLFKHLTTQGAAQQGFQSVQIQKAPFSTNFIVVKTFFSFQSKFLQND
jgi:hypothetical protein